MTWEAVAGLEISFPFLLLRAWPGLGKPAPQGAGYTDTEAGGPASHWNDSLHSLLYLNPTGRSISCHASLSN